MLEYVVNKVAGKSFFSKPRIMVCIPTRVTSVEKRAVLEATMQAGASKTYLIEEPLAAALGAGLDIAAAAGSMVVDIGGGTTDIAVLSLVGLLLTLLADWRRCFLTKLLSGMSNAFIMF